MKRKILLVDEWRAVRLLGRRVLSTLGFHTREARSGLEALEVFALEPDISAVLLEWKPQDDECVELVRRFATIPRHSRPAIIACGDVLDRSQIVAALSAGADEFLNKPYCLESLREKFEHLGVAGGPSSDRTETLSSAR
jgi:two-component system, chemotaxis family, chemotaxis protein CheY